MGLSLLKLNEVISVARILPLLLTGLLASTAVSAPSFAQAPAPKPPLQRPAPPPAAQPPAAAPAANATAAPPPALNLQTVNNAGFAPLSTDPNVAKAPTPTLIKAEVLLDRANFSPGVIDGRMGENVKNALIAYEKTHGLPAAPDLTPQVWQTLTNADKAPPLKVYALTPEDVAGPWSPNVGEDFVKMSKLKSMGYTSAEEMLAERFHMDQDLLKALNPSADFGKAGQQLVVVDPGAATLPEVTSIDVDKHTKSVTALDASGKVIGVFPATVGSTEKPSPQGVWKVKGVAQNPDYVYDPSKLTWGPRKHGKLHIPPGPNGPVGVVWIALTAPDYGIHGTPDPHLVGKTASHGCVRLTNWDAEELSHAVKPGVKVSFAS